MTIASAGIDIDAVGIMCRLSHGRMSVDNKLRVGVCRGVELLSDPKQIMFRLLSQRDTRPNACVGKEMIICLIRQRGIS